MKITAIILICRFVQTAVNCSQTLWILLRKLRIENSCFKSAGLFQLDHLKQLERVTIGNDCFCADNKYPMSCSITNCPRLIGIRIGCSSFPNFVSFSVEASSVKVITIGQLNTECTCFSNSSFKLLSSHGPLVLLVDLPYLNTILVGRASWIAIMSPLRVCFGIPYHK